MSQPLTFFSVFLGQWFVVEGILLDNTEAVARSCSLEKVFVNIFAKFTGKQLCRSLFFDKAASFRPSDIVNRGGDLKLQD